LSHLAPRTRETVLALRRLLDGERLQFDGRHVLSHGFRLRRPQPETSIAVAAFRQRMTEVAARHADEVVLNLVPPEHVRRVRGRIDELAGAAGRRAPKLSVWVPAALDPRDRAIGQLQGQLAVYLGAPGYGELFSGLGFESVVNRARSGARRAELARDVPVELIAQVGALGTGDEVRQRISAYHDAGADQVGIVPSTAEDPAGRGLLAALAREVVG
jgi:probable F420-dependent oxidoreductase